MSSHPFLRVAAAAAVPVVALALTGCGPGGDGPSPEPTVSPSESASAEPTPEPTEVAITIPECDDLIAIADVTAIFGGNVELLSEGGPSDAGFAFAATAAAAAVADADPFRTCTWGIPQSDGSFDVEVGVLSAAGVGSLESGLVDAGFDIVPVDELSSYEYVGTGEWEGVAASHIVTQNVWIASEGSGLSVTGQAVGLALDGMRDANPSAGL